MTAYCPSCGGLLSTAGPFCPSCGKSTAEAPKAEAPKRTPTSEEIGKKSEADLKSVMWLILLIGGFALYLLATTPLMGAGLVVAGMGLGLPILVWSLTLRTWTPRSLLTYALRFALWPAVVASSEVGKSLGRLTLGISRPWQPLEETLKGVIGIAAIGGIVFFLIGLAVGSRKFRRLP